MKNIEGYKKVINFYALANKLKTTIIDVDNNYSMADHLFGSIMLAIAINQEFDETKNVSKVIRMMLLDEFNRLNPSYDFKILRNGKELEKDITEAHLFMTNESRLIFKYRMLDYSLTSLIENREKNLTYEELMDEAIKIFMPKNASEISKYTEIFKFYYLNYRLKRKERSGWNKTHWNISSNRIERISEHIISTILLAIVMESVFDYNEELDFDRNIDIDTVIKLLSIHELGETLIGDITPFDGMTEEQKKNIEKQAMSDALGRLSKRCKLLDMLYDFEDKFSNEARFAYYCDKIEADLQSKYYQEKNLHHSLDDQENNCVLKNKKVQEMIRNGAKTPFDIWYLYDKSIYEKYPAFKEFRNILKLIKDNNVLNINQNPIIEKIELTKEEYNFITKELSKIIIELYKDKNIDSIYQLNYQSESNKLGTIKIVIVLNDNASSYEYQELINNLQLSFNSLNNKKFNIIFDYSYVNDYCNYNLNSTEIYRNENLSNSTILFDKTGKLTSYKIDRSKYLYPFNLVEYVPPIEDSIIRRLKK